MAGIMAQPLWSDQRPPPPFTWRSHWVAGAHHTTIVAPAGPTARVAAGVFDQWADDIAVRIEHADHGGPPTVDVQAFVPASSAAVVWERGPVRVSAVAVHHEPVRPAVAYRIDGPDGAVVVSGDTMVCDEIEKLAAGAEILASPAPSSPAPISPS